MHIRVYPHCRRAGESFLGLTVADAPAAERGGGCVASGSHLLSSACFCATCVLYGGPRPSAPPVIGIGAGHLISALGFCGFTRGLPQLHLSPTAPAPKRP
jgi:hypothetical protein